MIKEKYVYYKANGQNFREYEGEDSYIFTEVLLNSEWWFVWKEKVLTVEGKKKSVIRLDTDIMNVLCSLRKSENILYSDDYEEDIENSDIIILPIQKEVLS